MTSTTETDLEAALAKIEDAVKVLRTEGWELEAHEIMERIDEIAREART